MSPNKENLRYLAKTNRHTFFNTLNNSDIHDIEKSTFSNLLSIIEQDNKKHISSYININCEIPTTLLNQYFIKQNSKLLLPCTAHSNYMQFHLIDNLENYYPLKNPTSQCHSIDTTPDICIIPGLAFDQLGNRLGYGQGHYDKFLSQYPNILKVGICYNMQISREPIPAEPHDITMDVIITENQIIKV